MTGTCTYYLSMAGTFDARFKANFNSYSLSLSAYFVWRASTPSLVLIDRTQFHWVPIYKYHFFTFKHSLYHRNIKVYFNRFHFGTWVYTIIFSGLKVSNTSVVLNHLSDWCYLSDDVTIIIDSILCYNNDFEVNYVYSFL